MERDPLRFAWRAAPGLTTWLVLLVVAGGLPTLWIGLDLVRSAVDAIATAPAPGSDATRTFLRYAVQLPERVRDTPLVIFPGLELRQPRFVLATIVGLSAVVLVLALIDFFARTLAARIGQDVAARLADRMLGAIASAPIPAADEARQAADLAVAILERERPAFGSLAATAPIVGAVLALCILQVATTAAALAAVLLVALCALSFLAARRTRAAERLGAAQREAGSAMRRSLVDLARHLPALVAHGTRDLESVRIGEDLSRAAEPVKQSGRADAAARAATLLLALAAPAGVLALGAYLGPARGLTPGAVAAACVAAAIAVAALARHLAWRATLARLRPLFDEVARAVGAFQARRRTEAAAALPASGNLVALGLAAGGTAPGRLVHLDLSLPLPGHMALLGGARSGARTFAALMGGQLPAGAGTLTLGGVDVLDAEPEDRAKRLAFAGGPTFLFPGTLRANLLYGSREADGPELDGRLRDALAVAGLDRMVERRGLLGSVDPRREAELAQAIVDARGAIRLELERRSLADLVEPFDPARYNDEATIGENILFGVAVGDTFRDDRLPFQPFVKQLLDREGVTPALAAIGTAVARNALELFSDLPDEHALVGRFAPIAAGDRERYERILDRREGGRGRAARAGDTELLVALALGYSERRQRLGLVNPELRERVLHVRRALADTIPDSLEPAVEFFAADRICAAASVRDNLLFGRIAQDRAGAGEDVFGVVRDVLGAVGLALHMLRVGLQSRFDPADPGMNAAEIAAVDLVRCLVRRPDNLVVEHALDQLSGAEASGLARRLREAMGGRGLLLVVPERVEGDVAPLFPSAVRFENGRIAGEPSRTESKAFEAKVAG